LAKRRGTKESRAPRGDGERLAPYRDKRDPTRTVEPFGAERVSSGRGTRSGRFVVHHHRATRDHYDLRLQVGAALESFAVPRGPSLDPDQKRLAMHTEPHPLEYLDFEDVIPTDNYGAGPMIVWDTGVVRYHEATAEASIEAGKLDFDLLGFKLRGRFALIATGRRDPDKRQPNEWLLVKKPDASSMPGRIITDEQPYSVWSGMTVEDLDRRDAIGSELEQAAFAAGGTRAPLDPGRLEPMLCATEPIDLDDSRFVYELKLDGARVIAEKDRALVTLRYRHGRVCTESYPEVARAVGSLAPARLVLDGEMVSFDEDGRPRFEHLARRIQARSVLTIRSAQFDVPVVFVVFDLLAVGSANLLDVPLERRKALLQRLLRGPGLLRGLDHLDADGRPLFQLCEERDLEGLVAKRKGSRYRPGHRSSDWIKIKRERDDEFVIVGYVTGKGSRRELGALEVASYEDDALVLRGKVGSGLGAADIRVLLERLRALETKRRPYRDPPPPDPGTRRFVRPELVVSVRHLGYSEEGRLRFPTFKGLREDVKPEQCRAMPSDERVEHTTAAPAAGATEPQFPPGLVTNPDKVFWPGERYTKRDLIDYYVQVAPALLPFLKGRPTLLVRYPDGIAGKNFFQWNPPRGSGAHVRSMTFRDGEHANKQAFLIDHLEALVYVANLGCIPLHVLALREQSRDYCDFLTIDFDLNGQPFRGAIVLATTLREMLEEAGLIGFPKTSGQTGLHVLVPLGPRAPFEAAKLLAELLGRLVVARHPDLATMERVVARRGPRIYVDTGQTGRSRAIVAPYSVRAVAGATVSTPLFWSEVHLALDPRAFTIRSLPARLAERGDALGGLLDVEADLSRALASLEPLVRRPG
jgi:bifunctional non-homologous end joining protein LigD